MISKNQIKFIQSLHSKKNRDEASLFIIEGVKLVTEFITNSHFQVKEVYATTDYIEQQLPSLKRQSIVCVEVNQEELKKISLQTTPNKVLAVVHAKPQALNPNLLYEGVTLYLDDIRDPGNLGTIIRIADWFGIKQVICSQNCTELYNPKTLQASMGAVLRVTVVYMNFEELQPHIEKLPIYGAVLNGETLYTSKLQKGIIVIGNEANGISQEVMSKIKYPITIPAASNNGSESLNAANACAMICSEFHRQLNFQ